MKDKAYIESMISQIRETISELDEKGISIRMAAKKTGITIQKIDDLLRPTPRGLKNAGFVSNKLKELSLNADILDNDLPTYQSIDARMNELTESVDEMKSKLDRIISLLTI